MTLSIIIVAFNVKELLKDCVKSIRSSKFKDLEIIIVDSGSSDNPKVLKNLFPKVIFMDGGGNIGFSKANNLGASRARGKFLLFLNPDTRVRPDSLSALINFASSTSNLGAVSPKLLNPDGSVQPSCYHLPSLPGVIQEFWFGKKGAYLKYAPTNNYPVKVGCSVGAAVLLPRPVFDNIGGWDERYFMYFEDLELGRQIKKHNRDFWYLPASEVVHLHGASSSQLPDLSLKRLNESSRIYFGNFRHILITMIIKISQKLRLFP